jgi:AcrR family transcriptional regulator
MSHKKTSGSIFLKPDRIYRGMNREQRVAARRSHLLNAAIACFGTYGYHQTTLKMLCDQAGLTERYFYESFANLDDILCCAFQCAAASIFQQVSDAIAAAAPTTSDRMHAAVDVYFSLIGADKARARLVLIEIEGASERANAAYRAQLNASTKLILNKICPDLLQKRNHGLSKQLFSRTILGMIYQLAKDWSLSDFRLARTSLVHQVHTIAMGIVEVWRAE